MTINNLINQGQGCPSCRVEGVSKYTRKPDDIMISSFQKSGSFHPDTEFWRSDKKNSYGAKIYWYMYCPRCSEIAEARGSHLQLGKRPCACSIHRQQEAYIHYIMDDKNLVAIKFGIACDSKQRIKSQNRQSAYNLRLHSVYEFQDVDSCKQAEKECLQELECGVVLKRDMKDGWTETTWAYNLEKIIKIYERNGGVRQENT